MSMADANLNRVLGRLEGKMDLVLQGQQKQEERTKQLEIFTGTLDDRVRWAEQAVVSLKVMEKTFAQWQQRWVGAVAVIGVIASAIAAGATVFWNKIVNLYS
jgi:hypothetical protein